MAGHYLSVVRPQVRRFAHWALENLSSMPMDLILPWDAEDIKISRSEEVRILRAIYRHEVYFHLFGQNLGEHDEGLVDLAEDDWPLLERIQPYFDYISRFLPWEIEAMDCFNEYVQSQWADILAQFREDVEVLHEMNRDCKWLHLNDRIRWRVFLLGANWQIGQVIGMTARGLKLLTRIQALDSLDDQDDVTGRCMTGTGLWQNDWRDVMLAHEDTDVNDYGDWTFKGDSLSAKEPPLMWALRWEGYPEQLYQPSELEKRWGWVIWDAERWTSVGRAWFERPERPLTPTPTESNDGKSWWDLSIHSTSYGSPGR
ncbi:hypothetical protein F5Y03DRAFT_341089 [Xylaria venustula]|nr:hypothetical protein F5Y03DRAFT_341089 [Xylaria venustula]